MILFNYVVFYKKKLALEKIPKINKRAPMFIPESRVVRLKPKYLVDLIVNIAMISGANKDYSGRSKDLP